MIKFFVKDVTSQNGLEINQTIPKEGIGLSDEEIDLRSPISIEAKLEKAGHHIVAHAVVKADYGYLCSRCLEDFHAVHEAKYDFDFEFTSELESFDLGEEIRQKMIMAKPTQILCKDDCKGICPGCGEKKN